MDEKRKKLCKRKMMFNMCFLLEPKAYRISVAYHNLTKVILVTTEEYGLSKAARPENSRLDKSKLIENGFEPLPTWQDAVKRYLEEAKL